MVKVKIVLLKFQHIRRIITVLLLIQHIIYPCFVRLSNKSVFAVRGVGHSPLDIFPPRTLPPGRLCILCHVVSRAGECPRGENVQGCNVQGGEMTVSRSTAQPKMTAMTTMWVMMLSALFAVVCSSEMLSNVGIVVEINYCVSRRRFRVENSYTISL